ncbi:hypothetical protein AAG570_010620 [Ranatra chinensis]|uniref:DUF3456 domain-containing protein n=1 Tax=Ranatra chinensis TaxID=642074 RepID=A0ABD0Z960_9HEMI
MVEVGTYRLDHKGDQKQRMVEYRKSEVYLTEMMENICNRMDDYVRARMKSNGQLVVVPLITEKGAMNPIISQLDIIQDSDLNKSLKFYCEGILEEYEEGFVKLLSRDEDNLDIKLCSGVAKLCDQSLDQEDYKFEEEEEQHYSADHMEL